MTIYPPYEAPAATTPLDKAPDIGALQRVVGGYIEAVPGFNTIATDDGRAIRCVALCNEDGKRLALPVNKRATVLWDQALRRAGGPGLLRNGVPADMLCGPIVIITGDADLMESL